MTNKFNPGDIAIVAYPDQLSQSLGITVGMKGTVQRKSVYKGHTFYTLTFGQSNQEVPFFLDELVREGQKILPPQSKQRIKWVAIVGIFLLLTGINELALRLIANSWPTVVWTIAFDSWWWFFMLPVTIRWLERQA